MRRLFIILTLITLASPALAADYNFVNPRLVSPEFIGHPASNGSQELLDEAAEIIKIQSTVDKADIAAAESESEFKPELVTGGNLVDYPATYKLLHSVSDDCNAIVRQAKDYWHISRPYIADLRIKALITKPSGNSYSYPSGHTACSFVISEVYGQVAPSRLAAARDRANEIADHRIIGGVHWPQDIAGGREMGLIIFGALQMSDKYQQDVKQAKSEIKG